MGSQKRRNPIVMLCIVLALAVAVGGIGWFGHVLSIRTNWKNDRLTLSEHFTQAYRTGEASLVCGGETVAVDGNTLDYFFNFLVTADTVVLRKETVKAEEELALRLPGTVLHLIPVGDGVELNVQWTSDGKTYGYTVHGVVAYSHLQRYVENLRK